MAKYYTNYLTFFCKPTFRDFYVNFSLKTYGDNKAELYYLNHFGRGVREKDETEISNENIDPREVAKTLLTSMVREKINNNSLTDFDKTNNTNLTMFNENILNEISMLSYNNITDFEVEDVIRNGLLVTRRDTKEESLINILLHLDPVKIDEANLVKDKVNYKKNMFISNLYGNGKNFSNVVSNVVSKVDNALSNTDKTANTITTNKERDREEIIFNTLTENNKNDNNDVLSCTINDIESVDFNKIEIKVTDNKERKILCSNDEEMFKLKDIDCRDNKVNGITSDIPGDIPSDLQANLATVTCTDASRKTRNKNAIPNSLKITQVTAINNYTHIGNNNHPVGALTIENSNIGNLPIPYSSNTVVLNNNNNFTFKTSKADPTTSINNKNTTNTSKKLSTISTNKNFSPLKTLKTKTFIVKVQEETLKALQKIKKGKLEFKNLNLFSSKENVKLGAVAKSGNINNDKLNKDKVNKENIIKRDKNTSPSPSNSHSINTNTSNNLTNTNKESNLVKINDILRSNLNNRNNSRNKPISQAHTDAKGSLVAIGSINANNINQNINQTQHNVKIGITNINNTNIQVPLSCNNKISANNNPESSTPNNERSSHTSASRPKSVKKNSEISEISEAKTIQMNINILKSLIDKTKTMSRNKNPNLLCGSNSNLARSSVKNDGKSSITNTNDASNINIYKSFNKKDRSILTRTSCNVNVNTNLANLPATNIEDLEKRLFGTFEKNYKSFKQIFSTNVKEVKSKEVRDNISNNVKKTSNKFIKTSTVNVGSVLNRNKSDSKNKKETVSNTANSGNVPKILITKTTQSVTSLIFSTKDSTTQIHLI
jgi:hypothetical protein